MTGWRIDLTVLTDLSASMFAACFLILLIFLSLVQTNGPPPVPQQPIEAERALRLVHRAVLVPGEMVELLRQHDADTGISIDIFADHVEIAAGSNRQTLAGSEVAGALTSALPSGAAPVRLYVFSNALYNTVSAILDGSGLPRQEISVPRALRDPLAPMTGWSPAFLELQARDLNPQAFRQGLAVLLEGAAENDQYQAAASAGGASIPSQSGAALEQDSLLARLQQWLAGFLSIALPIVGVFAVLWIERRRLRVLLGHAP